MASQKKNIVFDLHGVVFRYDFKKIAQIFLKTPGKHNFILMLFYPRFWTLLFSFIKKGAVPEECIIKMATALPRLKPYIPTGIAIANAQKPYEETVEIIHALKVHGYSIYLFSNIGEQTLHQLKKIYPDILDLFDDGLSTQSTDNYLKKPNRAAFEKYSLTLGQPFHDIVFIDNKRKNIQSAKKLGIDGIFFSNPAQLYRDLIQRNLL